MLMQSRGKDLGQSAIKVIDADSGTAIVGEVSTDARVILLIMDLAIIIAVSRRGYVVPGQLLIAEDGLLQEGIVCRGCGLLHRRLQDGVAVF